MEPGSFITLWDFILFPFYLGILYLILFAVRNAFYPKGHPLRKYFLPAVTVKFIGAASMCFIYNYYYGIGDTTYYFSFGKIMNSSLNESFSTWYKLITNSGSLYDGDIAPYTSQIFYINSPANYMVVRFSAIANLLSLNTFLISSLFFAVFSFSGLWVLFLSYVKKYPAVEKYIAYSVLFVPSVFFWGSGVSKDALCIFSVGWIIYIVNGFIDERRFSIFRLFMFVFAVWLAYVVKPYIPISMAIPMLYLLGTRLLSNIRISFLRQVAGLFFIVVLGFLVPFLSASYSDVLGEYSVENFIATSDKYRMNMQIQAETEGGSFYSLGDIEPSTWGMVKKFPQAVNVTLFRPYIWESRSVIMIISALESTIFLVIAARLIYLLGFQRLRQAVASDNNLQFLLIFTLIFAFSAGITTFNFGTLSRYRIPCLPPFALSLAILYNYYLQHKRRDQMALALVAQNSK